MMNLDHHVRRRRLLRFLGMMKGELMAYGVMKKTINGRSVAAPR
jgi:hypothetical protein